MAISPIHVSTLDKTSRTNQAKYKLLDLVKLGNYEKIRDYLDTTLVGVVQDKLGDTPLHIAIAHNLSRVVLLLLLKAPHLANVTNYLGQLPLHCAVLANDVDLFRCLLLKTDNLAAQTESGDTVLHLLCRATAFDADVLQVYFDVTNYATLELPNDSGETAVHAAAQKANYAAVIKLAQLGVDMNSKNHNGETPLHLAIPYGDELLIKTFLRFGAHVNVKNNQGETVLHTLLQSSIEMYEVKTLFVLLLQAGANVNVRNNDGLTAIEVAEENFEPLLYEKFYAFYEQQCRIIGDGSIKLV